MKIFNMHLNSEKRKGSVNAAREQYALKRLSIYECE